MIPCKSWQELDGCDACGYCKLLEMKPSVGYCLLICTEYSGPPRGRGDKIKKAVELATFGLAKPCRRCKKRQMALNRKYPDGDSSLGKLTR